MEKYIVSDMVKELESRASADLRELQQIKATLIVNFGKDGRLFKDMIYSHDTPFAMMVQVLEHYQKLLLQSTDKNNP